MSDNNELRIRAVVIKSEDLPTNWIPSKHPKTRVGATRMGVSTYPCILTNVKDGIEVSGYKVQDEYYILANSSRVIPLEIKQKTKILTAVQLFNLLNTPEPTRDDVIADSTLLDWLKTKCQTPSKYIAEITKYIADNKTKYSEGSIDSVTIRQQLTGKCLLSYDVINLTPAALNLSPEDTLEFHKLCIANIVKRGGIMSELDRMFKFQEYDLNELLLGDDIFGEEFHSVNLDVEAINTLACKLTRLKPDHLLLELDKVLEKQKPTGLNSRNKFVESIREYSPESRMRKLDPRCIRILPNGYFESLLDLHMTVQEWRDLTKRAIELSLASKQGKKIIMAFAAMNIDFFAVLDLISAQDTNI